LIELGVGFDLFLVEVDRFVRCGFLRGEEGGSLSVPIEEGLHRFVRGGARNLRNESADSIRARREILSNQRPDT